MKIVFSKTGLFVYLLPLLFSAVFVVLIWQITRVHFSPAEDTIPLGELSVPILYTDIDGKCGNLLPDSLLNGEVFAESFSLSLSKCVKYLQETSKKRSRSVQIPHEWYKDFQAFPEIKSGSVLYRFDFNFSTKVSGLWAIVLPEVSQNAAVFLNGTLLGWGGSFEKPVARYSGKPQLFTIPEGQFREGLNQFDIYVVAQPANKGYLGEVYIAPIERLKSALNTYHIFRYTSSWMIALTIAILSFFMFFLWRYRPHEVEYGLFSLGGFFWVIHILNQFIINIPFSARLWDGMINASAGLLALTSVFFIHRLLDRDHRKIEKVLLIIAFILVVLMMLPISPWFHSAVLNIGSIMGVVVSLYVFILTVGYALTVKKVEWYALALALGIIAEFALYDLMVILELRPLYKGQLLHFGAPFILLSFAWILLQRFVNTLQISEKYNVELKLLNQDLESRVEARGKKIRQSYETIRLLGQEQVLVDERSRIMRDMHDGIGVYLTSMLRHLENDTIDKKQLSESARCALNDLRLMIDSLGSTSTDLPAMLGMFRTRISVALKACNIELKWHVEELPEVKDFGPERALNLLRILQETFTNAIKHSGATSILLSACAEPFDKKLSQIKIEIIDNGEGFGADKINGNGLNNMKYRAKKIKAEFNINTNKKGTSVIILLPVLTSCMGVK